MRTFSLLAMGLLAVVAASAAGAADLVTQDRQVDDFSGIAFALPGKLILTQGDEVSVTVTATEALMDQIVTEVDDGVLKIHRDSNFWDFDRGLADTRVEVTFVTLERLAMSGSGKAVAESIQTEELAIAISGSANVALGSLGADTVSSAISGSGELAVETLDAGTFESSISGSGEVAVAGRADTQNVTISGSGDHLSGELQSQDAGVVISGSGKVEVWATANLDAVVAGSGDVFYRGEPEISERVAGSGGVRQLKREM
ncbi:MAG: DUF2807 domain-containing protein [Gammaproteobacteria bacterium]|nr:DUF2807 domain-containing protein [Gammaproteobacteria bacterium]